MSDEPNLLIGPKLPTHLSKNEISKDNTLQLDQNRSNFKCQAASETIGPMLPPHLLAKQLPSDEDANENVSDKLANTEVDLYGPALPPHLSKRNIVPPAKPINSIGPSLPNTLVTQNHSDDSSCSEDDVIGPVPEGSEQMSSSHQQLEIRANYLKRKINDQSYDAKETSKREKWMLELPPDKAKNLGLGPRSFRMKEGPDMTDRSDWTDTPVDRARKQLLGKDAGGNVNFKEEMNKVAINERDIAMEHLVEKCKDDKQRMSLLEMHQKKLKKKKKEKKNEKPERRPFDRNIDLQANRFDEAQKKSIFKKAQLLNTRFSQGQSKYL